MLPKCIGEVVSFSYIPQSCRVLYLLVILWWRACFSLAFDGTGSSRGPSFEYVDIDKPPLPKHYRLCRKGISQQIIPTKMPLKQWLTLGRWMAPDTATKVLTVTFVFWVITAFPPPQKTVFTISGCQQWALFEGTASRKGCTHQDYLTAGYSMIGSW